jgi:uncharacterized repeat protein (TIGR02059 family)
LKNQFTNKRALAQFEATGAIEANSALAQALQRAEARLTSWANQPTTYQTVLLEVFTGAGEAISNSLQALISGQGLGIPVKIVDGNSLVGLAGAYASASPAGSECIYLNGTWLETASAEKIEAVLLEELGHAIDRYLHGSSDSPGDEGEIFSARLRGLSLPTPAITEQDQREVNFNGMITEIEASTLSTSLQFDGVDDCIEIADHPDLDLGKNFTLEAWIKPLGAGDVNSGGIIFNKENDYELARYPDGSIRFAITGSASGDWWGWHDTGYIAQLNTWTHVALTFSSGIATVFINGGTLAGGSEYQFSDPSVTRASVNDNTNPLRIGGRKDPSNTYPSYQHFDGLIANARVWKKAKYPSDIGDNYNRATPLSSAGLVGSWDLHEGSGSTAIDSSPIPKDGTLVGFSPSPWVTDSPSVESSPIINPGGISDNLGDNHTSHYQRPFLVDLDGDGDLDAIIVDNIGEIHYFTNAGNQTSAAFGNEQVNPFGLSNQQNNYVSSPVFVDIDKDGDQDAFFGLRNGDLAYFENVGDASTAAFAAATQNPFNISNTNTSPGCADPEFADIDGDGDLDLFIGDGNGNTQYFKNIGTPSLPSYASATSNPFGLAQVQTEAHPSFFDVDADGDLDALIGSWNGNYIYFENTGSLSAPSFGSPQTNPFGLSDTGYSATPTFADIDGDGNIDVIGGSNTGNTLLFRGGEPLNTPEIDLSGSRTPSFAPSSLAFNIPNFGLVARPTFADIDSDGDLDLFISPSNGSTYFVENIGSAINPVFAGSSAAFSVPPLSSRTTFADIDDDGDLDLLIGAANGNTYFFENNGNSTNPSFAGASLAFGLPNVGGYASPTLTDIDGDGDYDLFICAQDGNTYFFENNGSAMAPAFTGSSLAYGLPNLGKYATPTFTDIDADGDLDLFIGAHIGDTYFFENVGSSTNPNFSGLSIAFGIPQVGGYASPAFADIDSDGDLDLFMGSRDGSTLFFENTGSGGLSSLNANGTYGAGTTIDILVPFNQVVTVDTTGGTPTLKLETGSTDRTAIYTSGSGSNTLVFSYTVQPGDRSADLDYTSSAALELNGGTIQDSAGYDATLTLSTPGGAGSLAANSALVVNGAAPDSTLPAFVSAETNSSGSLVMLTYDEAIDATNPPSTAEFTLMVNGSAATISSLSVNGSTLELSLANSITTGQPVSIAYSDPSSADDSNAIQDAAGNDATTLPTTAVTNAVINFLNVTTDADTNDSTDGLISLREAIDYANATAGDDTITFSLSGTAPYTIYLSSALPSIVAKNTSLGSGFAGALTITGPGLASLIINGNGDYSIFTIDAGGELTLSGATISGAYHTSGEGGAFYNAGSLNLSASKLTSNTASQGAGIFNATNASLTVADTTFSGNYATSLGGGIYNASTNASSVITSTFESNSAYLKGGAIYIGASSTLNLSNSTLYFNYAQSGGGISNTGTLNISNSTLSRNGRTSETGNGAGISNDGDANVSNTIIAYSWQGNDYSGNAPLLNQNNIIADDSLHQGASQIDPALGELQDNGGPTFTIALREGSPALRTGDPTVANGSAVGGLDQRGLVRSATAPNIGAYEDSLPPSLISAEANSDGSKIILTFKEMLAGTTATPADFQVIVAGNPATISRVAVNGYRIELVLDHAIKAGESATVTYTDYSTNDDANAIQDVAGNDAITINSAAIIDNWTTSLAVDPTFGNQEINPFGIIQSSLSIVQPTIADIDGDGDLDLVVGLQSGDTLFYLNSAANAAAIPAYEQALINPFGISSVGSCAAQTFVDIDSDGDLDLFIGNQAGNILFFRNSASQATPSTPAYELANTNPFGINNVGGFGYATPVFVDIDNDNKLDLITGNRYGDILFFRNTGSSGNDPAFAAAVTNPFGLQKSGWHSSPKLIDIDGDGDLDMFSGGRYGEAFFQRNRAAIGSPTPDFAPPSDSAFNIQNYGHFSTLSFADLNNDGQVDLVRGNANGMIMVQLNINDFIAPSLLSAATDSSGAVVILTFSEALDPTNLPGISAITLNVDGSAATINSMSVNGSTLELSLATAITNGQTVSVAYGDPSASNDINAIQDSAGNDVPSQVATGVTNNALNNTTPTSTPTVLAMRSITANGTYGVGNTITIEVQFTDGLVITGSPRLRLETGSIDRFATFTGLSTTAITNDTLTFTYTVQIGDSSADLDQSSPNALELGSAILRDAAGNDAVITLATPGSAGSLSANAQLVIDGVPPTGSLGSYATTPAYSAPSTNPFDITNVGGGGYANPTLADIDADGDLDLFIGNLDGNTLLFTNTASLGATAPAYSAATTNPFGITNVGQCPSLTFGDIDADGDLDLFIGNHGSDTLLFRNIASSGDTVPAYSAPSTNPFGITFVGYRVNPSLVDIDVDGDLDLIIGNMDGNTLLFTNTASSGATAPAYSAATTNPFGITDVGEFASPTFADIDSDGDLDLFIGNGDGNTLLFTNTASSGATTPAYRAATTNPFGIIDVGYYANPTVADIDGDGDLDLFIGNHYGDTLLFTNTAATPVAPVTATTPNGRYDIGSVITITIGFSEAVLVDITGGTPRLQLETGSTDRYATYSSGTGSNTLFFEYTVQAGDTSADLDQLSSSALTLNGGTIKDAAGNNALLELVEPGSTGSLASNAQIIIDTRGPAGTLALPGGYPAAFAAPSGSPFGITDIGDDASPVFTDIDGDGDLDLFIGNRDGNTLFFQNTAAVGSTTAAYEAGITNPFGITNVDSNASPVFTDIDGDGDLDLFIGNYYGDTVYFKNTAAPGSTAPAYEAGSTNPFGITNVGYYASPVFTDIDGDGDLDLFIGNYYGNTFYFKNTAAPGSTAPAYEFVTTNPFGITDIGSHARPVLTDIDGDGDLDLFIGNRDGNTLFFKNTAALGSTAPTYEAGNTNPFGITDIGSYASPVLTDIDGDGDLDLFIGNRDGNTLFFQNTAVTYVAPVTSTKPNGTYGVGDTISLEVQFTKGLVLTGSPRLRLETGSIDQFATFTGIGTTAITNDTLTFTYTVQIGDSSADLDQSSPNALDLNGGTLKDAAGNDAILTLALPGSSGSLAANGTLTINTSTNNTSLGQNGADPDYERGKDINGDNIKDDLQSAVTTFASPHGPSSLALKTVVLNQDISDYGGSVVANTLLFFDALTGDSNAINGLQLSVSTANPGTTNRVASASDLINFTVTPTVTTTGDVRGLDVAQIRNNAIAVFQSTIQEIDIYFPENASALGGSWNALYKTRKAQNNSIEYYLFDYDPLTGLGGMLLDRDGDRSIDGARLYLKDGELGDFDEVVNGRIEDPIGFTTLSVAPTLRVTNGVDLTVDGIEGTGLWVSLAVSSFSSSSQRNLEMYNNGQPIGAIGATLGSGPTGSQVIYLAAGSTLSFRSSDGAGNSSNNPALSIASTLTGYSLGLDADRNGSFTDLMLDISSSIAASSPASLAIARKQLESSDAILDLTSIAATGITLTLDISTDCSLHNQFGFVKLELDPITGNTYQVNGISQNDGARFRSAVLSQFTNPYQGTGTSHLYNKSRQTITWNLDSSAAGYYAPVMITQGGEVLTFGASTASDGRQHVKLLGTNTFGFEDLLASQGSDWDFNDTKIRVSVA